MLKKHPIQLVPTDNPSFPCLCIGTPVFGLRWTTYKYYYEGTKYFHLHILSDDRKEIVASTDGSLDVPYDSNSDAWDYSDGNGLIMPQIEKSFLSYYTAEYNKGNIIEWVNVEYEEFKMQYAREYQLKLRSDNTVIIHPIKDLFTREEALNMLYAFHDRGLPEYVSKETIKKWFNEDY